MVAVVAVVVEDVDVIEPGHLLSHLAWPVMRHGGLDVVERRGLGGNVVVGVGGLLVMSHGMLMSHGPQPAGMGAVMMVAVMMVAVVMMPGGDSGDGGADGGHG